MIHPDLLSASRWLGASGLVLTLALAPVGLDPINGVPSVKLVQAKDGNSGGNGGGNGGGHGGGHGGGRDHADRGHGRGQGYGNPHGGPNGQDYASLDDFAREMRGSRGRQEFEGARGRYEGALAGEPHGRGHGLAKDRKATDLSPAETAAVMARGWKGKTAELTDGFKNHGQRVKTMVELAKQLGYGARVGAMQANFGTPFENGITDLQAELEATEAELAEARAALEAEEDPARTAELETEIQELEHEIEDLEGRLDQAIADAKPGKGPNDSWATADLDVNDDGVVDPADLEALETADGEGETTAGAEPGTDETSS